MSKKSRELDLSEFPSSTITEYTTHVCLACIFDIFTDQLGLAPRTAYSEIKKYSPTVVELTGRIATRPFFDSDEKNPHCPHCNAAKRWHARFDTTRIVGGKISDTARRKLVKSLPKQNEQFQLAEIKSDYRAILFDWLENLRETLDFGGEGWLIEVTRAFLERLNPKADFTALFENVRSVRPSKLLADGWERNGSRLFLAPPLYNEVLIVQYLVSRSQTHGGQTSAGRLTLMELIRRLRYSGYLDSQGISERDQFEILEKLVDKLAGGSGSVKLHYVIDRRDFLDKVKSVYARYAA
jgi:hypothetical protein